jgi:hypothetical protein
MCHCNATFTLPPCCCTSLQPATQTRMRKHIPLTSHLVSFHYYKQLKAHMRTDQIYQTSTNTNLPSNINTMCSIHAIVYPNCSCVVRYTSKVLRCPWFGTSCSGHLRVIEAGKQAGPCRRHPELGEQHVQSTSSASSGWR